MFQYTREIIINAQDFSQRADKDGNKELFIPNVGSYKAKYIKGAFLQKAATGKEAEITVPTAATAVANGDVIRYTVKLKMQTGEVDALLANYTTLFTRGIVIEVAAGSDQEKIMTAFKEAMRGMEEWPVRLDITNKKIKAITKYLNIELITEELKYRTNSISEMVVVDTKVDAPEGSVGIKPFGTYECLVKNNRLPTMENIRPWGEAQEEYPIRGKEYDLFEIKYVADRNIGGFDVLGQKATSITTHRFWVDSTRSAAFSAALEATVPEIGDLDGSNAVRSAAPRVAKPKA